MPPSPPRPPSTSATVDAATSFNQQLGGAWYTSTADKYRMFDRCPGSIVTPNQQLQTAVLANDVAAATKIFSTVAGTQGVRLANAIDWRGKSVLMHAASRDHAEMVALLVQHNARVEATDYTGGMTVGLSLILTLTLTLTRIT